MWYTTLRSISGKNLVHLTIDFRLNLCSRSNNEVQFWFFWLNKYFPFVFHFYTFILNYTRYHIQDFYKFRIYISYRCQIEVEAVGFRCNFVNFRLTSIFLDILPLDNDSEVNNSPYTYPSFAGFAPPIADIATRRRMPSHGPPGQTCPKASFSPFDSVLKSHSAL